MGGKRVKKDKDKEDYHGHLRTNLLIDKLRVCDNCPLKLYNKKDNTVIYGIGNIQANIIIIVKSYNVYKSKELLIKLNNIWKEITGNNILEDVYITRLIKCYNNTDLNLDKDAINYCKGFVCHEICRILPTKVIVFGNYSDYIDVLPRGIKLYETYDIGILYYDNVTVINKFKEQLRCIVYDNI